MALTEELNQAQGPESITAAQADVAIEVMPSETEKSKSTIQRQGNRGLRLESLDDLWRFAGYVHDSGLAPTRKVNGVPVPISRQSIVIRVECGLELGLPAMQALWGIADINGRPCVWGDHLLAVCKRTQLFDQAAHREWLTGTPYQDDWTAHVTVRRLPNGRLVEKTFSWEEAKKAGLTKKSGTWQEYPQRMLLHRARAYACREAFPDPLTGIYIAEEMPDYELALGAIDLEHTAEQLQQQTATRTEQVAAAIAPKPATPAAPETPAPSPTPAAQPKKPTAEPPKSLLPEDDSKKRLLCTNIRGLLTKLELPDQKRYLGNYGIKDVSALDGLDEENLNNLLGDIRHEQKQKGTK